MRLPFIVFIVVALLACLSGCEGKIKSPLSGNEVTASELVAEEAKADRDAAIAAQKEKARADARLRAAKLDAERKAIAIAQEADMAASEAARQLKMIELELGSEIEAATKDAASALDLIETAARFREDAVGDALEAIAAKESRISGLVGAVSQIPVVGQALGSVGVDSSLITGGLALLLGGGAASVAAKRSKKREDDAWDEAQRAKESEVAKRDAVWDEAIKARADADREHRLNQLIEEVSTLRSRLNPTGTSSSRVGPLAVGQ